MYILFLLVGLTWIPNGSRTKCGKSLNVSYEQCWNPCVILLYILVGSKGSQNGSQYIIPNEPGSITSYKNHSRIFSQHNHVYIIISHSIFQNGSWSSWITQHHTIQTYPNYKETHDSYSIIYHTVAYPDHTSSCHFHVPHISGSSSHPFLASYPPPRPPWSRYRPTTVRRCSSLHRWAWDRCGLPAPQ